MHSFISAERRPLLDIGLPPPPSKPVMCCPHKNVATSGQQKHITTLSIEDTLNYEVMNSEVTTNFVSRYRNSLPISIYTTSQQLALAVARQA